MDNFKKASRLQVRFESSRGPLSVEDLWNLPLTSVKGPSLDGIAVFYFKKLKEAKEVTSFVDRPANTSNEVELTELRFNIVKDILDTITAERKAASDRALVKAREQKLLEMLEKRRDAKFENMSEDEILKELEKVKTPATNEAGA